MAENCKNRSYMITPSQIRQIHTLKNILGLDDELYRDMLASFDVYSSKKLTETEATIFIEKIAFTKKNCHKKYDELYTRDRNMATPPQLRKIEAIWSDISNAKSTEEFRKSLRHFISKQFHIDDIRFMTKYRASKIIAVLEKIKQVKFNKELKAL